jgi:hypothetical protein
MALDRQQVIEIRANVGSMFADSLCEHLLFDK